MLTIGNDNIGRDSLYVTSVECDGFYKVKPSAYFGLNQELAGVHAFLKGAGLKKMMDEEGRTWMILRTRMEIGKIASWTDEYNVETWCQEGYRLYCPRAVRAFDKKSGELLFSAENHWVIMDVNRGRPEKPSYVDDRLAYVNPELRHFDPAFPKFPNEEEYKGEKNPRFNVNITYYDSDYNRHINNIIYVTWLLESFPHDFLDTMEPTFFDVEWKRQCHNGDKIWVETTKKEGEEEYYTKIMHITPDGVEEVAFHAISKWKKKA